jgi:hypothetical protein
VCSTAVVAAGASFFAAGPAGAAGVTLAYGPNATSATIANLDPTVSSTNAATAYGLKVTGASASDSDPLRLSVLSGPTSGAVKFERVSGSGAPVATAGAVTARTTVDALTVAGTTTNVQVVDSTGFVAGHVVALVGATGATTEYALIASIPDGTHVTLASPTVNAPAQGKAIYDIGPVKASTVASADPSSSATATVSTTSGFAVGDWIYVQADTAANSEVFRATALTGSSVTLSNALSANHASGNEVVDLGRALDSPLRRRSVTRHSPLPPPSVSRRGTTS